MTVQEFLRSLKHHLTCIQNAADRLEESLLKTNPQKGDAADLHSGSAWSAQSPLPRSSEADSNLFLNFDEVIEKYPGGLYGYIHDRGAVKTVVDAAYRMGGPTGKISEWNLENPITREFAEKAFNYARTLPFKLDDLPKEFL
jgi:hypothetical protein